MKSRAPHRRAGRAVKRAARKTALRAASSLDRLLRRTPELPEPLSIAESNHRFAAEVIREARARAAAGVETTFAEAAVHFFVKGIHQPMFAHYVRYALGSLARGEKLVKLYAGDDAAVPASYLDVGCAYGGAPIAIARRGVARAVGFEYDARLLSLARTLAAEEGVADKVRFVSGDLTSSDDTAALGSFALVTCIDVLEHVLDPEAAIANLATLAEPGGTVIVDVPNPRAYQPIRKDPHHHIFGSVLLPRDDAIRVFEDQNPGNKRYTVGYFHPLEWYVERLERAGFAVEILDRPPLAPEAVAETLAALDGLRAELDEQAGAWPVWRADLVRAAIERFYADSGDYRDLAAADPAALQRRHAVPVYHLRCVR